MQAISPGQVLILECQPADTLVVRHPQGEYQYYGPDGTVLSTPYRELARDYANQIRPGSRMTLPMVFDELGNQLYSHEMLDLRDVVSHIEVQAAVDKSLEGTGVKAVVLPACVKIAGVVG